MKYVQGRNSLIAQVARATPIISEFTIVIWSKFHLSFTLSNINSFLEITPLSMLVFKEVFRDFSIRRYSCLFHRIAYINIFYTVTKMLICRFFFHELKIVN